MIMWNFERISKGKWKLYASSINENMKKPELTELRKGYMITWQRGEERWRVIDRFATSALEAWKESEDFFRRLGCTESLEGLDNNGNDKESEG